MTRTPKNGAQPRARKNPKTKPDAPGAGKGTGDNSNGRTPDEVRSLFIDHRRSWIEWKAKRAVVDKIERDVKAALKSDGYTVKQMEIADSLATVKGEAKITGEVKDRLKVARWMGHPMGAQLDMFENPDRTPAVDRAFDEGKQASMENQPRKPHYDPSTPQYGRWMDGYDDHQRALHSRVGRGDGTLSTKEFQEKLAENAETGRKIIKESIEQRGEPAS